MIATQQGDAHRHCMEAFVSFVPCHPKGHLTAFLMADSQANLNTCGRDVRQRILTLDQDDTPLLVHANSEARPDTIHCDTTEPRTVPGLSRMAWLPSPCGAASGPDDAAAGGSADKNGCRRALGWVELRGANTAAVSCSHSRGSTWACLVHQSSRKLHKIINRRA